VNDEGARQSPHAHNRDCRREPTTRGGSPEGTLMLSDVDDVYFSGFEIEACT
jgi:hypothetical protein